MIRRGRRQADRFHGELYVVYVQQDDLKPDDQSVLEHNLACAAEQNAPAEVLHAEDAVAAILQFATAHGITQIFVGHSQQDGWMGRWKPNPVERLIMEGDGIDIRIFPKPNPNE